MRPRTWLLALAFALLAMPRQATAVTVHYMLWDSTQAPAYRQCAAGFERANPGIHIDITQVGWADYWTDLTIDLIAGSAPDVFTDHLTRYPQFVRNDLIVDLTPYLRRDHVDLRRYPQQLLNAWRHDGKLYGIPKDWDTEAIIVNLNALHKAGLTRRELQNMTWNPKDGGSFARVIAQLSVDTQGHNALSPLFDPHHVAMFGFAAVGNSDMSGQVDWSSFAESNGFKFQDAPWAPYHYDDPRLAQALGWLAGLPARGWAPPVQSTRTLGPGTLFEAGKVAMIPDGSWMIDYYAKNTPFPTAWIPLPIGPLGYRASMLNGLTDALWSGSKVKEQAWQWIRYLASQTCQQVVADHAVTFPALPGLAEQVIDIDRKRGIDASAFLTMRHAHTFLTPIAAHVSQVNVIMKRAMDAIFLGKQRPAAALRDANTRIGALLDSVQP